MFLFLVDTIDPVILNRPSRYDGYSYYSSRSADIRKNFLIGTVPRGSIVTWEDLNAKDNFGNDKLRVTTGELLFVCLYTVNNADERVPRHPNAIELPTLNHGPFNMGSGGL